MEAETPQQMLNEIEGCLDQFDPAHVRPGERLACSQRVRALASRMTALSAALLAEADAASESLRQAGTPTTSWLATRGGLSKREAAGILHQARELRQRPAVGEAAIAGAISINQARAIGRVLDGLTGLSDVQTVQAEQLMVGLAQRQDCDQLAKSAPVVLAAVAPDHGAEAEERRLQRQAEAAQRNRSLVFGRDGEGSVTFSGSLPQLAGEAFITFVDSYAESRRRNVVEERDPAVGPRTPAQRRADGLLDLIAAHERGRQAPPSGGDRPRVMVVLDYEYLRRTAAGAGLIADGQPISAGDLRRVCCDADLVPAVLAGPSEILDVGRERRLVTPPIRSALALRDQGCVFPGCQTRAAACEAHHLEPWWAGGVTALSNLALLCRHHHALVEPAKFAARDQWELRIAADGVPEAIPPRRFDRERRPMRHARFADPPLDGGRRVPPETIRQSSAGGGDRPPSADHGRAMPTVFTDKPTTSPPDDTGWNCGVESADAAPHRPSAEDGARPSTTRHGSTPSTTRQGGMPLATAHGGTASATQHGGTLSGAIDVPEQGLADEAKVGGTPQSPEESRASDESTKHRHANDESIGSDYTSDETIGSDNTSDEPNRRDHTSGDAGMPAAAGAPAA